MDTPQNEAEFRQKILDDPVYFCRAIWEEMGYDIVAPIGDPETHMMRWLAGQDDAPAHRGCLAPRSIGKTHIACAVLLWRVYLEPHLHILITSKSETEAKASLSMVRGWIKTCWFLKHLEPNTDVGHKDHALGFDVGPSVPRRRSQTFAVVGIGGQLAGKRAHIVLADDVETESNTETFEARSKLDTRVKELQRISSFGKREVVYIGTFQHEESVYIKLNDRGYIMRTWPILYPAANEIVDAAGNERILNLAPDISAKLEDGAKPGKLVFSHRHDNSLIDECKAEGLTGFYMHYMLIADLGDKARYPLKLRDLMCVDLIDKKKAPISVMWGMRTSGGASSRLQDVPAYGFGDDGFYHPARVDEAWTEYLNTYMWIDPSGAGADKTGYACVAFLNGYLWLKDIGGLEGGFSPSTLRQLSLIARENRATKVFIEGNFGGGMLQPLLEPYLRRMFIEPQDEEDPNPVGRARQHPADVVDQYGWACSCETVHSTGQKERRILEALEPVVQQHRVVIDRRIADNKTFQRQFTRITRQRECLERDDEIESFAMCCAQWVDHLGQAPEDLEKEQRADWIDEEIEAMQSLAGVHASGNPWFQHV